LALAAPEAEGAELCSAAPPDVSALPDGGWCADFEVSCDTPGCVGSILELSTANTGEKPSNTAKAVPIIERFMSLSLGYPCNWHKHYYVVREDIPDS